MQRKESVIMDTPEKATEVKAEELRYQYGFWVAMVGFVLIAVVFVTATMKWATATDVSAVVGLVTSMVGTVVGAFFGVNVGSAGRAEAENRASKAEKKAVYLAGMLNPNDAQRILDKF
jgi:hypothetical protein